MLNRFLLILSVLVFAAIFAWNSLSPSATAKSASPQLTSAPPTVFTSASEETLDPDVANVLQSNIDAVKTDVSSLRGDVTSLAGQLAEIKSLLVKAQAGAAPPPPAPAPTPAPVPAQPVATQPQLQAGATYFMLPDGRLIQAGASSCGQQTLVGSCGQQAFASGCGQSGFYSSVGACGQSADAGACSSSGADASGCSQGARRCGPLRRILGRCQ